MVLFFLRRVEDYTFIWTPNLITLQMTPNQINYIAKDAFYGLNSLQELDLSNNSMTEISYAFEVFRNSISLRHIDLSSNRITSFTAEDVFHAVSTSLKYLNFDINNAGRTANTNWLDPCKLLS